MFNKKSGHARRGVVLLLILALLAFFAMLAVVLLVVAAHHKKSAQAIQRFDQYADSPQEQLHQAFLQVATGSDSPASVLRVHGLLEDLYGEVPADRKSLHRGAISIAPVAVCGGQLLEFPIPDANRQIGCVLTMLNGPAAGRSTLIVGRNPDNGNAQVLAFDGLVPNVGNRYWINGSAFCGAGFGYDTASGKGDQFYALGTINVPYALAPNPVGFVATPGYDDPAGPGGANEDYDGVDFQNMLLAMVDPDVYTDRVHAPSLHRPALINYWVYQLHAALITAAPAGPGLTDAEAWQAILQPWGRDGERGTTDDWAFLTLATADDIVALKRRIFLRPIFEDHPDFYESNPNWAAWNNVDISGMDATALQNQWRDCPALWGPWDVDADGDGVADSIWVDLGFPVRSTPDGRLYKPMFAILCVDQDGKLNVNAHGSLVQLNVDDTTAYHFYDLPDVSTDSLETDRRFAEGAEGDATGPSGTQWFGDGDLDGSEDHPSEAAEFRRHGFRGLGTGPAEINLLPLFDDGSGTYPYAGQCGNLMTGIQLSATSTVEGRHGESELLLTSETPYPGVTGTNDGLSRNKLFYYPGNYSNFTSSYGTPGDLKGFLSIGLDLYGQPLYAWWNGAWANSTVDDPYELNLFRKAPRGFCDRQWPPSGIGHVDNPFSAVELERLLRPHDVDTPRLPSRLSRLAYALLYRRHEVTTESWDLPCPSTVRSADMGTGDPPRHVADLVADKLRTNGFSEDEIRVALRQMLPPEVLAGLRMDLNRPIGNGVDDAFDSNTVVDDYYEEATSGSEELTLQGPAGLVTTVLDHDNDGTDGAIVDPRQLYARHLYVLMMAVVNMNYLETAEMFGSEDAAARAIAQWAVNVADFRDRDSIMAAFEYDANPWNGWDVDGILGTPDEDANGNGVLDVGEDLNGNGVLDRGDNHPDRRLVWGCERPELLISENKAIHDRRTDDLADYGWVTPPSTDDDTEADSAEGDGITDLDQAYRPQGTLIFELYNPWVNGDSSSQLEPVPGEFYSGGGVDLAKLSPDGNSPVWRLMVVLPEPDDEDVDGEQPDPDDPDSLKRPTLERTIYFVDLSDATVDNPGGGDVQYYPSAASVPTESIGPGRYAVVAPAQRTYLGFQAGSSTLDPATTRNIFLDAANDQVNVVQNGPAWPANAQDPVLVVIDEPAGLRLSVSEPTGGYPALEAAATDQDGEAIVYNAATGRYESSAGVLQSIDQPLDAQREDEWNDFLGKNATTTTYRVLHLQRLADPLRPWNATTNPYRTIDSMAVDLTSFNGRTRGEDTPDYLADGSAANPAGDVMFHARQRGERNDDLPDSGTGDIDDTNQDYILWKQEPASKDVDEDTTAITGHYFNRTLDHTLGYLNKRFGALRATPTFYQGAPLRPFPWLTWNNRPFVSHLEVLMVPALGSSKLLGYNEQNYYKYYRVLRPGDDPNPYSPDLEGDDAQPQDVPFPHLINFFHSDGTDSPQFHRVLEFLRVPSPFVGAEVQCNTSFAEGTTDHQFHPPLHMISRRREPGRLNLNTIFSADVFRGLLNLPNLSLGFDPYAATYPDVTDPQRSTLWHRFVQSRRGYFDLPEGDVTDADDIPKLADPTLLDEAYPTRLTRPFRSFAGKDLVPTTSLETVVGNEVNSTILRAHPANAKRALFEVKSDYNFNNTQRNPFFRYQGIERLGNLVTTRSNVYAVWITVGYFEVERVNTPLDASVYPDGYRLGPELGSDTGEIKRHRAFYIFDRSIPVGFERGKDLNVEEAILLKRYIE